MANKPLTKEQKLDILSKSIDAGAHIDINFHPDIASTSSEKEIVKIFKDMDFQTSARSYEQSRWVRFSVENDNQFSGVLFFPQNQPLPKEWQDTGDMEEANA